MARARIASLSNNSLIGGTFTARRTGGARAVRSDWSPSPWPTAQCASWLGHRQRRSSAPSSTERRRRRVQHGQCLADRRAGDVRPSAPARRGMTILDLAVGSDRNMDGPTEPSAHSPPTAAMAGGRRPASFSEDERPAAARDPDTGYGRASRSPRATCRSWYGGTDQPKSSGSTRRSATVTMRGPCPSAMTVCGLSVAWARSTVFLCAFRHRLPHCCSSAPPFRRSRSRSRHGAREADIDLLLVPKGSSVVDIGYDAEPGALDRPPCHG